MKSALKIENLFYKNILKNINLNIEENNIYALVGKSGSGKTTLLKCICNLLDYSGAISSNYELNNIGIYINDIKLLYDDVYSNLSNPLINLGISKTDAKKRVFDVCKNLDIDSLIYNNINKLSYSEKKILMLAKTLINDPKLILLDNIFEGVDCKLKNKALSYLKQLKNKTIVFVTTNPEDLLLSDKIIILNNGSIIECANSIEVLENEKLFTKNDIKMPFIVELSHKLKSYELIDDIIIDDKEMVDAIWK